MKKTFFVFIICLFNIIPVTYAGSGEFNGTWLLTRDHIHDGVVDATKKGDEVELVMHLNSHFNKLTGNYTEIKNDSVFTGETYTSRGTTLIILFQYGKTFYAIHNGRKVGPHRYVGAWFASGEISGDFELRKK